MNKYLSFPMLSLVISLVFAGCATEYNLATGRQEILMYGSEKEVRIGDAVSRQIEKNYEINTDVDINERAQRILDRVVAVCDRQDIVYTIRIIEKDLVNAVSLPGGYIYIFKGMVDHLETDDQLAGVIAHEVGHITAKHALKRLQGSYASMLLQLLAIESGSAELAAGVNALYTTVFLSFARQDEYESDRLAVKYTRKAGYDPAAMKDVLHVLQEEDQKKIRTLNYFRTHPYINERIAALNQAINGHLEFRDYLDLTGSGEGYH